MNLQSAWFAKLIRKYSWKLMTRKNDYWKGVTAIDRLWKNISLFFSLTKFIRISQRTAYYCLFISYKNLLCQTKAEQNIHNIILRKASFSTNFCLKISHRSDSLGYFVQFWLIWWKPIVVGRKFVISSFYDSVWAQVQNGFITHLEM